MAGDWDRFTGGKKPSLQDKKELDSPQARYEPDSQYGKEVTETEALEGPIIVTERLRFNINTRRARISPGKKRAAYIRRLEKIMRQCDKIIANPGEADEIQVKAMGVLIRSINVCYGMIVDVEVEELEQEIRSIEGEEEKLGSGEKEEGRGYHIKEDPAE